MWKIDKQLIKSVIQNPSSKSEPTNLNQSLIKQLAYAIGNVFHTLKGSSSNETAQWIRSSEHTLSTKGLSNFIAYKPKSIVNVELGVKGNELSFRHPCIVMFDKDNRLFVIPCTSGQPPQKNGKTIWGYKKGSPHDGFNNITTVILKESTFIDKTRVISVVGKVSDTFYSELYNEMFNLLFESKAYEIKKLENKVTNLQQELDGMRSISALSEIATTSQEIEE